MAHKCKTCNKYLWEVRKKRCDSCVMDSHMKFKTCVVSRFANPCGGTTLYRVLPKQGVDQIRLHHILYWMLEHYEDYSFTPIHQWGPIWRACDGWVDPKLEQIHRGKIKRGIMNLCGNGVMASVEDMKGNLYAVVGSWG